MTIYDAAFDTERELQEWAYANCRTFFGDAILLNGFRITTLSGKHAIPDGFAFNFKQRAWWIVECELLVHGVWPHIAEQLTRFVVAARNPATVRQLRDKLFEKILSDGAAAVVAQSLATTTDRLLQQLELFIEGVAPSMVVLIDDTDRDLIDFCNALDVPTDIYRVKKFLVDGRCEYYSPDRRAPIAISTAEGTGREGSSIFDVVEQLGGGEIVSNRNRCFKIHDGRIIKIQYSKLHERHNYYWYGITPSGFSQAQEFGATHFVFVLGDEGFVVVPVQLVEEYLKTANTSNNNDDGSIRHYHVHISPPPELTLKSYGQNHDVEIGRYFRTFD